MMKYSVSTDGPFFVAFEWLDRDLKYDEEFMKRHDNLERSPIWVSANFELVGKKNSYALSTSQSKWETVPVLECAIQATIIY